MKIGNNRPIKEAVLKAHALRKVIGTKINALPRNITMILVIILNTACSFGCWGGGGGRGCLTGSAQKKQRNKAHKGRRYSKGQRESFGTQVTIYHE
jgi:hypothetical protein